MCIYIYIYREREREMQLAFSPALPLYASKTVCLTRRATLFVLDETESDEPRRLFNSAGVSLRPSRGGHKAQPVAQNKQHGS